MYRSILENIQTEGLNTLRFVVLAGEKASSKLIKLSNEVFPNTLLINEYGPTENCIVTTCHMGIKAEETQIIGKPIANNHVYILNKNNDIMPIGIAGELCVSGKGLAKCYLNNPELTSVRAKELSCKRTT